MLSAILARSRECYGANRRSSLGSREGLLPWAKVSWVKKRMEWSVLWEGSVPRRGNYKLTDDKAACQEAEKQNHFFLSACQEADRETESVFFLFVFVFVFCFCFCFPGAGKHRGGAGFVALFWVQCYRAKAKASTFEPARGVLVASNSHSYRENRPCLGPLFCWIRFRDTLLCLWIFLNDFGSNLRNGNMSFDSSGWGSWPYLHILITPVCLDLTHRLSESTAWGRA